MDPFGAVPEIAANDPEDGNALKGGFLQQSNLFESLNFRYFGRWTAITSSN